MYSVDHTILCAYMITACRLDPEPSLLISYTSGGLVKLDAFTRKIETIANDTQVEAFDYHYGYQVGKLQINMHILLIV